MKAWFQKFRISNALNDRRPMPPAKAAKTLRSIAARRFAAQCQALEQRLKSQLPAVTSPPALHAAIMGKIRTSARPATVRRPEWISRWQLAGSCVLLVGLSIIWARHLANPPAKSVTAETTVSLAMAGSALDLGNQMICAAPSAMVSPLVAESASLDRELTRAGNFIIASLP